MMMGILGKVGISGMSGMLRISGMSQIFFEIAITRPFLKLGLPDFAW